MVKAAKRFLKMLIKSNPTCDVSVINTDKNPAYGLTIKELKQEGSLASDVADHDKLKRLINPARGFQSMKTAYATIRGFEIM